MTEATKEIKEILDYLKRSDKNKFGFEQGKLIDYEETQLLLDYITNLQQENKAKTHQIEVLEEIVNYERNIRNDKLQQENEKLKYNTRGQVNDYFKNKYADEVLKNAEIKKENEFLKLNNPEMNIEHFRVVKENKRKIDNLRKENKELKEELKNRPIIDFTYDVYKDLEELEDYKSRFEKANTYINEEIKKIQEHQYSTGIRRLNKIQNILNGSDEK